MSHPYDFLPTFRKHSWTTQALLERLGMEGPAGAVPVGNTVRAKAGATWMITGATGWMGRHLARDILMRDPEAFLLLPVRAPTADAAMGRLRTALGSTQAMRDKAMEQHWWLRIQALPILSLAETGKSGLPDPLQRVDHVVHSAANLSLALGVEGAWQDNVVATQRVFEWARRHGACRFDHLSTLSVFVAGDTPMGGIHELDPLDRAGRLWGGYAASKWAAEAWLARQQAPELALAVHRLGLLSYSHVEGWATNDGLACVARAFRKWGKPHWAWSAGRDFVDWSPADSAAAGIVRAIEVGATGPLHWASERPVPGTLLLGLLEQAAGREGSWPEHDELAKHARRALGRWHDRNRAEAWWWHDIFQSGRHRFHADRASGLYRRWDWAPDRLLAALREA